MSHFRKFIDRAERVEGVLSALGAAASGISIVGLVLLITVYVIGRKFGLTLLFVEEWGGYLLVLITYMGAAYALSKDAHVQMRLVLDNVPVRVRMLLSVFFALAGIPLIGFLSWLSMSRVIGCIKLRSCSLYYMETLLWIPSIFVLDKHLSSRYL